MAAGVGSLRSHRSQVSQRRSRFFRPPPVGVPPWQGANAPRVVDPILKRHPRGIFQDHWRERHMTKRLLLVLALCAGLTATALAAPGAPANPGKATVGEFAVRLATALGYDAADAKAAAGALNRRGVTLAADLSATLTEGDAARIISDLGIATVTPANPGAPVSAARAGSLVASI